MLPMEIDRQRPDLTSTKGYRVSDGGCTLQYTDDSAVTHARRNIPIPLLNPGGAFLTLHAPVCMKRKGMISPRSTDSLSISESGQTSHVTPGSTLHFIFFERGSFHFIFFPFLSFSHQFLLSTPTPQLGTVQHLIRTNERK